MTSTDWPNARSVQDDLADEFRTLPGTDGRGILVLGSASLIRQLLAADLLDELRINLCPELLGNGLRLFEAGVPRSTWGSTR